MIDIVFPDGNEAAFASMATNLGITKLIFAYKDKKQFYTKKSSIPYENALITEPRKLHGHKDKYTICPASRDAIERGATVTYDFEQLEPKDHTHYRRSGLNHILCKLATTKNVRIGYSVSTLLKTTSQKRSVVLGRIMQNIRLCQKYNTPMKIASFATDPYQLRSPAELTALFSQLGMQPHHLKKALN